MKSSVVKHRLKRLVSIILDRLFTFTTGKPAYMRAYKKVSDVEKQEFSEVDFDLVYVLPPKNIQHWILHAICKEIDKYYAGSSCMVSCDETLPAAKVYFYSHYAYFRDVVLRQSSVLKGKNLLFYTHPRDLWFSEDELIYSFSYADNIISMCSMFANELEKKGVSNTSIATTGADNVLFHSHVRGNGVVGFCSAYYPRKNGDMLMQIVKLMPDTRFKLCGKDWDNWEKWDELKSLPNLEYLELDYSEYPGFYASLDVFVSVSTLEGGPIPLIEAMMSNVVPVASNMGHAPDIIEHEKNGFLFDVGSPATEICNLILQAMECTKDIRKTVEHLTWQRFSKKIQQIALC